MKLALFLSSLAACLFVTIIGVVCTRILILARGVTGAATNYNMLSDEQFSRRAERRVSAGEL